MLASLALPKNENAYTDYTDWAADYTEISISESAESDRISVIHGKDLFFFWGKARRHGRSGVSHTNGKIAPSGRHEGGEALMYE